MGKQIAWKTAQFTSIFTILWLIAGYSFPLTHTILEMAGVVIAWMLFLFVWNARPFLESKFLLFIGFSYLFTGFFQLIHCMAFVETGLFPGSTENLVAQFCTASRLLEAGSLLAAFFFIDRNLHISALSAIYLALSLTLLGFIFGENSGLLILSSKAGDFIITASFLAVIFLLYNYRKKLGTRLFPLLAWSTLLNLISGLLVAFLSSSSIFILSSHFLRITGWYLLYRAIITTGFVHPYNILFGHLNRIKEAESEARKRAEARAAELDALRANLTDMLAEHKTGRLLESILVRAVSLLNAEGSELGLYDRKRNEIVIVAVHNRCNRKGIRIPLGYGVIGSVAKSREPMILHGNNTNRFSFDLESTCQSLMAAPLIAGSNLVGVLMIVESNPSHEFTWADLNLFTMFAQQAAITIRNTRLLEIARRRAETDSLTGLFNHRHFFEAAGHELNRAKRYKHPLTVLMFDIDRFKEVNDTFGHAFGDQVLISISNLCRKLFRNIDIAARYGGEEFVVLLPETPVHIARDVAERLRKAVAKNVISYNRQHHSVTISVGIASFCGSSETAVSLIERADQALYKSKQDGRNRVSVWTPSMRNSTAAVAAKRLKRSTTLRKRKVLQKPAATSNPENFISDI
ncbi:MAG: diguanylate cyclase [Fibrobacter sp.]|jgi:diguanylate cyclase (GGDEF)-like protein|nr:diguanylate cyclase [Fibrobacter sp.]